MLTCKSMSTRILGACFLIVALVGVAGYVGYSGICTVGHSLFVVGDEEAPLVDAANEMKLLLMVTRNAMEEYKAATATLATANEGEIENIVQNYNASLEDFDVLVEAVLNGRVFDDGTVVYKTDNEELAQLVQDTAQLHDEQFQKHAQEMMASGQLLLEKARLAGEAMEAMEGVVDEVIHDASEVEEMLSSEIWERANAGNIGEEAQAILKEEVPLVDMANEIKIHLIETRITLEEYVQGTDLAELESLESEFNQLCNDFDEHITAILEGGEVDGVTIVASDNEEVLTAVKELDQDHEKFQQAAERLMAAHQEAIKQTIQAEETMAALDIAGETAEQLLTQVEQAASQEMANAKSEGNSAKQSATMMLIVIVGISIFLGIFIGMFLSRKITSILKPIVNRAEEIAQGDLTGEELDVKTKCELGQLTLAVNKMSHSLRNVIEQVSSTTNEVAGAANEIAASSEEMSSGMEEQTQQVMQVSTAIEEMSATVVEVAKKSAEAAGNADDAGKQAQDGGQIVTQTINGMRSISEVVSASAEAVGELGKRGEQIGEIISVINDIADQTNLLALNAAIEAARAGEHGRGFAVVADEVRKLAERTTQATEEVSQSIKAIQSETTQAVERMNAGTASVAEGVKLAEQAGGSLRKIVDSSTSVAAMIQSIAAAAEEQSAAAEQISRNVESISAVTRQAAEGSGQAATAATQLSRRGEELKQIVSQFRLSKH